MRVKKYRAPDRSTALKQIRAELGPEAVIVHEQRVRRGPLGLFGKPEVEILAAIEERDGAAAAPMGIAGAGQRLRAAQGRSGAAELPATGEPARNGIAGAAGSGATDAEGKPTPLPHAQPPRQTMVGPSPEGASRLAAILGEFPKKGEPIPPAMAASLAELIARATEVAESDEGEGSGVGAQGAGTAERDGASPDDTAVHGGAGGPSPAAESRKREVDGAAVAGETPALPGRSPLSPEPRPLTPDPRSLAAGSLVLRDMQHTLVELRSAVERLSRQSQDEHVSREAPAVRTIYQHLMAQEIEPTLALELVGQISEEVGPDHELDAQLIRGRVVELLEERLPTGILEPREEGPRVVVLLGPTGVGKTTTLAKLAAHLALHEGKKVCLITTDTFRIAAAGQLGTYATIMDLPLDVVYTPAEFAGAVERRAGYDFILVDTPGCAPRNEAQIQELAGFVAAVTDPLVLLTVAAQTKFRDLMEIQQGFGVARPSGLVLSKLDETSAYGPVLSLVARADVPVFYVTAGQNVPSDIEAATPAKLVGVLLDGLFGAPEEETPASGVELGASPTAPAEQAAAEHAA